jgi:hypothetical protein
LRMAALPDFIAREAMLAMTSGRASKMMRSTPMGQVCRWRMRPSSSSVLRSTLPTIIRGKMSASAFQRYHSLFLSPFGLCHLIPTQPKTLSNPPKQITQNNRKDTNPDPPAPPHP